MYHKHHVQDLEENLQLSFPKYVEDVVSTAFSEMFLLFQTQFSKSCENYYSKVGCILLSG